MKKRKPYRKMGKRGNIADLLYVVLFLFVFGITSILAYTIWINAEVQLDSHLESDVAKNVTAKTSTAILNLDYVTMMILIGLLIVTVVAAFFLDTHPVFFVASFLLLMLMLVLMPILSNVFADVTGSGQLAVAADEFDITTSFFDSLPQYFMIMAALVLIAMFAKHKTGGGAI